MVSLLVLIFIIPLFILTFPVLLSAKEAPTIRALITVIGGFLFVIFFCLVPLIKAFLRYKKEYYWITNKRVLIKKGFIGYHVYAIPFERISDIIISRSFLEQLLGFGSLMIQSLAGQASFTYGGERRRRFGAEGSMLAVPEPEETQELIFNLIKEKRKKEKLKF